MLIDIVRVVIGIYGAYLVLFTLNSAVRSFVLPRGERHPLLAWIFIVTGWLFDVRNRNGRSYEELDRSLALFAPVTLLVTPLVWIILILFGYACIYWALGTGEWAYTITLSGSSLLTLGTTPFINLPITLIQFSEATIGLGIVALLISYLPIMYAAFERRETLVSMLQVRAGSPPTAFEFITRLHRIRGLDSQYLNDTWSQWEIWFVDLDESHTSLAPLVFFRSPHPQQSWITAAGTILDAASLIASTVDIDYDPQAALTIRAGYLALRHIADFFDIDYDPKPRPDDPTSISRQEYDEICDDLAAIGVPLLADRDTSWQAFNGWRVNYDTVLLKLARLIQAPYAPWISDRSALDQRY